MKPFFSIKTITPLILAFFLILIFSIILITNNQKKTYKSKAEEIPVISPAPEASPSAILTQEIEAKNQEVLTTLDKYNSQPTDEQTKQELINKVKERNKKIREGLDISPYVIYQKAFDNNTLNKFPEETKPYLEQRLDKTITGLVNTYTADDFKNNKSYTYSTITDEATNQEYNFYPTSEQTSFITYLSSTKVALNNSLKIKNLEKEQVKGEATIEETKLDETKSGIKTDNANTNIISIDIDNLELSSLNTLGNQKILVLLAKTPEIDENILPKPSEIKDRINGRINDFFKKNSYNKFSINADVIGKWYPVKISDQDHPYDLVSWFSKTILTTINQDIGPSQYDFGDYGRFVFVIALNKNISSFGDSSETLHGISSFGNSQMIKIQKTATNITRIQASQLLVFLDVENSSVSEFTNTTYKTIDSEMSEFDQIFSHELGHSLGAMHAKTANIYSDAYWTPFFEENDILISTKNAFDIMGYPPDINNLSGFHFNSYIKHYFKWIGDDSSGALIRVNSKKPDGGYTLKQMGEKGDVALWLPFATDTFGQESQNKTLLRDFFLEVRYNSKLQKNVLNINLARNKSIDSLAETHLFLFNNDFEDKVDNIKIININSGPQDKTLTFTIATCNDIKIKDNPFYLQSLHAGDSISSYNINVFESDIDDIARGIRDTNKSKCIYDPEAKKGDRTCRIESYFSIENKSNCYEREYNIDKNSILINSNQTQLSRLVFYNNANPDIKPQNSYLTSFGMTVMPFDPSSRLDSSITFNVIQKIQGNIKDNDKSNDKDDIFTKSITFYFHLVPTPEEFKTDFEPHFIRLINNDNNQELNNLNIKKGQKILFKSSISNNSKSEKVGVTTPDFKVQWFIKRLGQEDPLIEERHNHQGLSSMTRNFESPASTFLYQIPADLPAGDYKVIYEVLKSKQIDEFNENNNIIFREFTVVE